MNPVSSIIRLFLLFILGIFILLFFYIGLYLPKREGLTSLESQVPPLEQKILSLKQEKTRLASQVIDKKPVIDVPESLMKEFPRRDDMPDLLSAWAQKGKSMGIEFLLFEPLQEVEVGPLIEMPIQLTLRGTYHQTLSFFNYLSSQERKILLSQIQMTEPQKRAGEFVISTHATVTTFRRGGGS